MSEFTYEQGVALLKQRAEAQDNLVEFAKLIDIPAVPVPGTDDQWEIIDTPLATHHLLTLYALQSMACGRLMYSPDDLSPITRPTPDGLVWVTARGGSPGGGVGQLKVVAPSGNLTSETKPSPPTAKHSVVNQAVTKIEPQKQAESVDLHGGNTSGSNTLVCQDDGDIRIDGDVPEPLLRGVRHEVCRRVMIMQPPGSAKSTYGSVVFPVWDMGRVMDQEIILTGWGDPICRRHGKRARKICESELYRSIMSTGIDPNTRAAEDWGLMNQSTYKSSGINSGVAGFRCDGLIWDDLTKNRKEADSQTKQKNRSWHNQSLY